MKEYINNIIEESIELHKKIAADINIRETLEEIAKTIADAFLNGNKLIIFGNGGSAADAQHIAAEFLCRFEMERPPLPAIAVTTDSSMLTAIGNDYQYNDVFEKPVFALGNEGDIVWGISTSGNSENVIKALRTAIKNKCKTVGFSGKDGGRMHGLCTHLIVIDSNSTARIQEAHIMCAHIICGLVDEIMFGKFSGAQEA